MFKKNNKSSTKVKVLLGCFKGVSKKVVMVMKGNSKEVSMVVQGIGIV